MGVPLSRRIAVAGLSAVLLVEAGAMAPASSLGAAPPAQPIRAATPPDVAPQPTGLTYLRARYYNPSLGRFTSRDSWPGSSAAPQTLNQYAYVINRPTNLVDPSGHCAVDTLADVGFIWFDIITLASGPEKEAGGNWLALGADIGGALLPCVTGASLLVRGGVRALDATSGSIRRFNVDTILLDPNRLNHLFQSKHNLDRLGSQSEAIDKVVKAVFAADAEGLIPAAGKFDITRVVDGFTAVIRGAIVNGELRIGTAFIP